MDKSIKKWTGGSSLLDKHVFATVKYDGLKINIVKYNNQIYVSYKGALIYDGEHDYPSSIKLSDILKLQLNNLKNGDALFCEYLTKKPTLMSSYNVRTLIVLGHARLQDINVKYGRIALKTSEIQFDNDIAKKYANIIGAEYPEVLIDGGLYPYETLLKSCNRRLRDKIKDIKFSQNKDEYYEQLVDAILTLESLYGGKDEGVVVTVDGVFYKIQQAYQLDPESRRNKKRVYGLSEELVNLAKKVGQTFVPSSSDEKEIIKEITTFLKTVDLRDVPVEKHELFLDEVQKTARTLSFNNIVGNRNGLVIGKFRVLTKAHEMLINQAKGECDNVVIAMVVGKNTAVNEVELRKQVLNQIPGVTIIEVSTGNIHTILTKIPFNIGKIYAGSDRYDDYVAMSKFYNIKVVKKRRNMERDVSATKIIQNIDDKVYFNRSISKYGKPFYAKYKAIYS